MGLPVRESPRKGGAGRGSAPAASVEASPVEVLRGVKDGRFEELVRRIVIDELGKWALRRVVPEMEDWEG